MRPIVLLMILSGLGWLTGCQESGQPSNPELIEDALPYISSAELKAAMAEQERPILVEFCVPVGCFRCDEMRPQINQLALDKSDSIEVVRVNLNHERALAIGLGVKVCPTYIAFDNGQPVFSIAYPTSADLIASDLDRMVVASTTVGPASE